MIRRLRDWLAGCDVAALTRGRDVWRAEADERGVERDAALAAVRQRDGVIGQFRPLESDLRRERDAAERGRAEMVKVLETAAGERDDARREAAELAERLRVSQAAADAAAVARAGGVKALAAAADAAAVARAEGTRLRDAALAALAEVTRQRDAALAALAEVTRLGDRLGGERDAARAESAGRRERYKAETGGLYERLRLIDRLTNTQIDPARLFDTPATAGVSVTDDPEAGAGATPLGWAEPVPGGGLGE